MHVWLPRDVELVHDVAPSTWLVERLRPWGEGPVTVGSFVPTGFEGYARIVHPARAYEPFRWVRWSELAARRRLAITAETSLHEATGIQPQTGPVDGVDEPLYGSMPEELVDDVAAFLRPWTTTRSTCWVRSVGGQRHLVEGAERRDRWRPRDGRRSVTDRRGA